MILHLNFSSEEFKVRQNTQVLALSGISHADVLPSSSFFHPVEYAHQFCHNKNSDGDDEDDDDDDDYDDTDDMDDDAGYDEEGTDYNDDTLLLF